MRERAVVRARAVVPEKVVGVEKVVVRAKAVLREKAATVKAGRVAKVDDLEAAIAADHARVEDVGGMAESVARVAAEMTGAGAIVGDSKVHRRSISRS